MENAARKFPAAWSLKYEDAMALISNGSMMLLKYKLNNVCDADHGPANGAQRTMIILICHNILWLSVHITPHADCSVKGEYALSPYKMRISPPFYIACKDSRTIFDMICADSACLRAQSNRVVSRFYLNHSVSMLQSNSIFPLG